jgi:tetratricopeptide (TPR) repeat protein
MVTDEQVLCPTCGRNLLTICGCGITYHVSWPKCPECGRRNRVRRRKDVRRARRRRFLIAVAAAGLAGLLVVNLVFVFQRSPRRRLHQHYQDGHRAFEKGRYRAAESAFQSYLALDPDRADARYMLGVSLLQQGKEEGALSQLGEALRLEPGLVPARVALSGFLGRRGRYREALEHAALAVRTTPTSADALANLGDVKRALGDERGAIDANLRVLEMDPGRMEALLALGDLYVALRARARVDVTGELARRRYEEAERLASEILKGDRLNSQARRWRARATAALDPGERAVRLVTKLVRDERSEPEHRLLLGRLLRRKGEPREAAGVLRTALVEAASPQIAVELSALLADDLADLPSALRVLEEAQARFPRDPGIRLSRVVRLTREGRLRAAERVMGGAMQDLPGDAAVLEARGDLHLAARNELAAIDAWRKTLEAHPQNLRARRKLLERIVPRVVVGIEGGDEDRGLIAEAERHLAFFLDPVTGVNPSDRTAQRLAARIDFARGDWAGAAARLRERLRLEIGFYEDLKILGLAHLRDDSPHEAGGALVRALRHPGSPRSPADHDRAYRAARLSRRHDREIEIARLAVARWEEDPEWRLRLAESYLRAGWHFEAIEQCAEARKLLEPQRTGDVRAHLLAARIYRDGGDLKRVRDELDAATLVRRETETRAALYAFLAASEGLDEDVFLRMLREPPGDPEALLGYGDFLLGEGRREEALARYEEARRLAPESRAALFRVAEVLVTEEIVEEIRRLFPDDPRVSYFAGRRHLLGGEYEKARAELTRFVDESPDSAAGRHHLGVALRREGEAERARDVLLTALALDPDRVETKLELAALCFLEGLSARFRGEPEMPRDPGRLPFDDLEGLGDLDRAADEAERVLEGDPDDIGALFLTGVQLAARGELPEAEARFARLLELRPENHRSHLWLGRILTARGEHDAARDRLGEARRLEPDAEEVLEALLANELAAERREEATRIAEEEQEQHPDSAFVHRLLGDVHRACNRPREAVKAYRQAFALSPSDDVALSRAAYVLADEGEAEKALEILAGGARVAERPAGLLTLRGRMLLSRGEDGAADTALREALVADPDHAEACRELGLLSDRSGRQAEARVLLERAVDLGIEDAPVHLRLGQLAAAEGRAEEAEARLRRVLELSPDSPPALATLAEVIAESEERREEALALARQARALAPRDPAVADTLGWILYRMDGFDQAVKILEEAAAGRPDDAAVRYHAGLACFRTYRWEEARRHLERALDLAPDRPEAVEARRALEEMP